MWEDPKTLKKLMFSMIMAEAMTMKRSYYRYNKKDAEITIRWVKNEGKWGIPFSVACEVAGLDEDWTRAIFLRKARKIGIYNGPIYIKYQGER